MPFTATSPLNPFVAPCQLASWLPLAKKKRYLGRLPRSTPPIDVMHRRLSKPSSRATRRRLGWLRSRLERTMPAKGHFMAVYLSLRIPDDPAPQRRSHAFAVSKSKRTYVLRAHHDSNT